MDINVPDKAVSDQSPSHDNHPARINQLFVELFFICSVTEKHNFEINKTNTLSANKHVFGSRCRLGTQVDVQTWFINHN